MFYSKKCPKRGVVRHFSVQIKALNISLPFLHALTDYRQIAEEVVEKPRTYRSYSKMRKFENARWRRPPSWIYKHVNNFRMDWVFWWNLNCIYLGITEIGKFHQKCEIVKIQDDGRPPSWIYLFIYLFNFIDTEQR